MEVHAQEQLAKFTDAFPNTSCIVKWGSPAEELVSEATPDCLLVVAQVGHSGIERLLFGSTAARVVKHAPCDVLVVRGERKKKR
jgi:universal stress protein A